MSWKHRLSDFALMTLGAALVAVGVYFFKFPNHFSTGGVSGLSLLLGELVSSSWLTPATFNSIINVFFLILGFFALNKGFGFRTVYCSLLYSALVQIFEWVCPLSAPLTDQKLLELFFAVILPAVGSAILFNINASTGGTDIAAMVLKKCSGMNVGRVFDIESGLCSLLGLALKSVLVDSVIESLNRHKAFFVVTTEPEPVCQYITHTLARSATVWDAQGAYTHTEHWVVLTVLSRGQAVLLRRHLKASDPHAFMIVANSSEIFGKGFLRA